MAEKSELEQLISTIKKNTTQKAINKSDEVQVMKCMLNDKNFSLAIYDKNLGYIGEKSPHNEAVKFVKNIIMGSTGLDGKDSLHLAENYEFVNRDAAFLIDNFKDFINVYSETGRKINIIQNKTTEGYIYTEPVDSKVKLVPDKKNSGDMKKIVTSPFTKLISESKCPIYNKLSE